MDHLPTAKNPLYSYPQVPYFEDSRFTYSGPAETFKSRIDPRQIVSPNENWKRAYSSFVQQWLYFGTLSEFASIHKLPFQPRDFVQTADDGTEVISTKLLNDYLVAFILEDHRATGITLTGGNPSMKNIMDGTASGVMWHAGRTIHEILKRLQQGLREISASGDLDARVWDSLLILGSTLIRSAEAMFLGAHDPGRGNMSRHVSFAEFETRSIPPFSTNGHWCPRERRVMADLVKFGQCELAFLGQIDRGEHIELHKECDETKCIAYHVKDHANPMKHCLGDCGSKYFSDNGGRTCTTIGRGDGDLQLNDEHPSGEIVDGRGPSGEGPDSEKNDDKTIGDKGNEEKDDRIEAANPRGTIAPLAGITNWAKKVYDTTSRSLERSDQDHSSKENSQGETADSKGASGQASNGQMTDNKTAAVQSNGGESDDKEASDQKSAVTPLAGITNWAHKVYDNTSKSFGSVPAIVYREGEWATLGGKPQRKPGRIEIKKVPLIKSNLSGWANWPVEGWNLVAVSHVWADGLGNTDANEVPECQLARIQGIVNSFFKESQWPVPFWLDTIMIPKTVDHPTDADKAAKKTALRNMEWVYKNASKVIVLDHTLMNVGTEGMCPEEIGARIMSCPWARRLWTLQEGCLEDRTHFLFQDRAEKWPKLHTDVQKTLSISKWKGNYTQLPKKHPLRKYVKPHGTLPPRGVQVKQPGVTKFGENQWLAIKQQVDSRAYQALNPVWWSIHDALQDMSVQWSVLSEGWHIPRCMRAMFFRDCSKRSDESLVLASLMHSSAGSAAELNAIDPPDPRYKHLFQGLSYVPEDIIFMDQERYDDETERIRWIPKSLLNVQCPASHPMQRTEKDAHNRMGKNKRLGVRVTMSAFLLHPRPRTVPATPFQFAHERTRWEAHMHIPGTDQPLPQTDEEGEWVLLPERLFYSAVPRCAAVLLKVVKWQWRKTQTRHVALVELTSLAERRDDRQAASALPLVEVEFVDVASITSKTTSWLVG